MTFYPQPKIVGKLEGIKKGNLHYPCKNYSRRTLQKDVNKLNVFLFGAVKNRSILAKLIGSTS